MTNMEKEKYNEVHKTIREATASINELTDVLLYLSNIDVVIDLGGEFKSDLGAIFKGLYRLSNRIGNILLEI